jgi:uncharacterized protein YndB with AHSA1/START domain
MRVHEHTGETAASPAAVWRVLSDLNDWESWGHLDGVVRLQGPFGVGSEVVMKHKGQDAITSLIVEAVENKVYADETSLGGVMLRFSHALEPLERGGTRVLHRLEITGPAADQRGPELGPAITEDFPEAMDALLARAGS